MIFFEAFYATLGVVCALCTCGVLGFLAAIGLKTLLRY